jgi:uncharacterized membrane protein
MNTWNDLRLERVISTLLRTGVLLSAVIVLLGGICHLVRYGSVPTDYRVFHSTTQEYRSIPGVVHALSPENCRAIIQLGLLLLIATPIARVAFSLVGFALERDYTYVVITSIVLVVLIYSFGFEH